MTCIPAARIIRATLWSGTFLALSMKLLSDPWTTIGTLAIFKNIQNINQKAFILLPAIRRSIPKPCIVAAFTYFKNLTHHLNRKFYAVINYELVNFPSLLEKMLTTFFNMSRSIFASLSSLSSRAISRSWSVIFGFPLPGKLFLS